MDQKLKVVVDDVFQGMCIVSASGQDTISCYDEMMPRVRERLRNSRYNLCAACVETQAMKKFHKAAENRFAHKSTNWLKRKFFSKPISEINNIDDYQIEIIEEFEAQLSRLGT